MSIAIGSDHAGYELKHQILEYFDEQGIDYVDYGCYSEGRTDYPDFAEKVGREVVNGKHEKGVVICGTGIGVSISANKIKGIRAALCTNEYMAEKARQHNNANVLALGGRTTTPAIAFRILYVFLNTSFQGGRHAVRVEKINQIMEK